MLRTTIIYFFIFLSFMVITSLVEGKQCHPDLSGFCLELLDENNKALVTEELESYTHKATIEFPSIPFGKAVRRTITLSNISTSNIEGFATGFNGVINPRNVLWSFQNLTIDNFFRSPNECNWFPTFFSGLKVTKKFSPKIDMIYAPLRKQATVSGNHAIELAPLNQSTYITFMRTNLNFKNNIEDRDLENFFEVSDKNKSEDYPTTISISISKPDFDSLPEDDQLKDNEYLFVHMEKKQASDSDNQVIILFEDELANHSDAITNTYLDTLGDTTGHSHRNFGANKKNCALRLRDTTQATFYYWFFFREPGTITLKCYPLDDSLIASKSEAILYFPNKENFNEENPDNKKVEVTAKSESPLNLHTPINISPEDKETLTPINTSLSWRDDGEITNSINYYVYIGEDKDNLSLKGTQKNQVTSIPKSFDFTPKDLKSDRTYYWKVVSEISFDGKTYRYVGDVWSFTTKSAEAFGSPLPSDGAENISPNTPSLSWDAGVIDSNITYYVSLTDLSSINSPVKREVPRSSNQAIFYPISSDLLKFNSEYSWQVEKIAGNGKQTLGPIWRFKTGEDNDIVNNPPNVPSRLYPNNGQIVLPPNVQLTWSGGDTDTGDSVTYEICWGKHFPSIDSTLEKRETVSTNTYQLQGLEYDKTYWWKIISKDSKGLTAIGGPWTFRTKTISITATAGDNGNITASWDKGEKSTSETERQIEVPLKKDQDVNFKMEPDPGYEVGEVKIDSESLDPRENYPIENIFESHTINVSFKIKEGERPDSVSSFSDGAKDVPIDNLLISWKSAYEGKEGYEGSSYEVFWSKDPNLSQSQQERKKITVTVTSYSIPRDSLEYDTVYYWQVKEFPKQQQFPITESLVWTFKTEDEGTADSTTTTTVSSTTTTTLNGATSTTMTSTTVSPTTTTLNISTTTTTTSTTITGITTTTTLYSLELLSPPDRATRIAIDNIVLSWKLIHNNSYYTVYLGKSDDLSDSDIKTKGQSGSNYEITEVLDYVTTYYWKIEELTTYTNPMSSPIWSFTTVAAPTMISGLATDFGTNGLWLYNGNTKIWIGLTAWNPDNMLAWGNKLAADFGEKGLYVYGGSTWTGLITWNPENITVWGNKLAADFGEKGLYVYDGSAWTGLTAWNPENLIAWGEKLAADFGTNGVYVYDGSAWTGLAAWNPDNMIAWGNRLAADFNKEGLWLYDGSAWKGITGWDPPKNMIAWGSKLVAGFGASYGLYLYDGNTWTGLTGWNPENLIAWGDKLAADFGSNGLWLYDGKIWTGIAGWNPENIVAWESNLLADFGSNGLYLYNGSSWTGLTGWNSEEMKAVKLQE